MVGCLPVWAAVVSKKGSCGQRQMSCLAQIHGELVRTALKGVYLRGL